MASNDFSCTFRYRFSYNDPEQWFDLLEEGLEDKGVSQSEWSACLLDLLPRRLLELVIEERGSKKGYSELKDLVLSLK